jgi:hypothetical protein
VSDYYDGYREGRDQANREIAALRSQLEAHIESISDLRSLTMPPPPIHLTMPTELARKPMTDEELQNAANFIDPYLSARAAFKRGIRFAEKHHGIGTEPKEDQCD